MRGAEMPRGLAAQRLLRAEEGHAEGLHLAHEAGIARGAELDLAKLLHHPRVRARAPRSPGAFPVSAKAEEEEEEVEEKERQGGVRNAETQQGL